MATSAHRPRSWSCCYGWCWPCCWGACWAWSGSWGATPPGCARTSWSPWAAAAYTIAGTFGVAGLGTKQDPGRVAAQIVTGVGFLGAGTIWRNSQPEGRGVIYGLTTAASIWVAAAVGMACGFGLYFLGAACAVLGLSHPAR